MSTRTTDQRRPRSGQTTIRDVARLAGVGVGTVSRVLNDSPGVSDQTRDAVRAAIEQLGYRRSISARNLAIGRTHAVGLAVPFLTTASVTERVQGVMDVMSSEGGYELQMVDATSAAQRNDAFVQFARRDRMDGLILIALSPTAEELRLLRSEVLPVVLIDARHDELPSIFTDDVSGGELAAEHLLSLGHRRIGFVGDHNEDLAFHSSEDRRIGLRRRLKAAGIAEDPALDAIAWLDPAHRQHRRKARVLAERLLDLDPRPTAVFAASDYLACGVIDAARERGLDVPGDLAVLGFDDIDLAEMLQLSTVHQPLRHSGIRGAEMMLDLLRGERSRVTNEVLELTVVRRATT